MSFWLATIPLILVVICCWIGALGAWRMAEPTQSLHYLAIPAAGCILLALAVLAATGWSSSFVKSLVIAGLFMASNSVGAHATARSIRVRRLGHWEPQPGDDIEIMSNGPGAGSGDTQNDKKC